MRAIAVNDDVTKILLSSIGFYAFLRVSTECMKCKYVTEVKIQESEIKIEIQGMEKQWHERTKCLRGDSRCADEEIVEEKEKTVGWLIDSNILKKINS